MTADNMYLTKSLSRDNKKFFDAWEEHTPWVKEATFLTQFVKREWHEELGSKLLKCQFKVCKTNLTISLLANAYDKENGIIYSSQKGDIDWSKEPEPGEFWWITIRSGFTGSYIWLSAKGD